MKIWQIKIKWNGGQDRFSVTQICKWEILWLRAFKVRLHRRKGMPIAAEAWKQVPPSFSWKSSPPTPLPLPHPVPLIPSLSPPPYPRPITLSPTPLSPPLWAGSGILPQSPEKILKNSTCLYMLFVNFRAKTEHQVLLNSWFDVVELTCRFDKQKSASCCIPRRSPTQVRARRCLILWS